MVKVTAIVALTALLIGGAAAHGGSGNRNCAWSGWSGYGSCSSVFDPVSGTSTNGVQIRTRFIAVTAAGGGQGCRGGNTDRRGCQGCTLTQWTGFGQCTEGGNRVRTRALQSRGSNGPDCSGQLDLEDSSTCLHCKWKWGAFSKCDGATKTRVIDVTQHPRNGGNPCPTNADGTPQSETEVCKHCRFSEWSTFQSCANGKQSRTRSIISQAVNGGDACPAREETQTCGDCTVSQWNEWSDCSPNGVKFREQKIISTAQGAGTDECKGHMESMECTPEGRECVYEEFGTKTACDNGAQESFSKILVEPSGGNSCVRKAMSAFPDSSIRLDKECSTEKQNCKLIKFDSCTMPPEDCQVSEWSAWDSCEHTDDQGNKGFKKEQRRTRTVTVAELHNGKCELPLLEQKDCPKNCEVSSWSSYGECDIKLLKKFRTRVVDQKESKGGSCEENLEDSADCAVDVTGVYVTEELSDADQDVVYMDVDADMEDWDTGSAAAVAAGGALSAGGLVYIYRRNIRRTNDEDDDEDGDDDEDNEENDDKALATGIEMSSLADGWTESTDPNTGKTYFFNRERGTSTWNRAEASVTF